jgi:hypothetical protein
MNDYSNFGTRLEDGAMLPDAIEQTAEDLSITFCDVTGFGELEWVELSLDDHGTMVQRFEGPLQLIYLKGRLRSAGTVILSDFYCAFSRLTDNGIELLGGKIHRAFASFVELTFAPLQSIETGHTVQTVAAAPPPREIPTRELRPSSPPPPPPNPPAIHETPRTLENQSYSTFPTPVKEVPRVLSAMDERWAKAVVESKRIEEQSAFLEEEGDSRPHRGDIVMHNQFGECQVTRIDDDHITLRKPDGRNVQLGLTILRFVSMGKLKGKDAFRVEIGKR